MEIKSILNLSSEEEEELAKILTCQKAELSNSLSPFSSAALEEMVSMFLGQKVFNRGTDLLEYRLFLLIIHAFDGKIPDEQEVSKLFQTTTTGSRSLIRAVMSKYQYQLKTTIENSLKNLLVNVTISEEKDSYTVSIHNLNLVDELNLILSEKDTNLPPVQKKRGSVSTYEILPSSYLKLCEYFNVKTKSLENNE